MGAPIAAAAGSGGASSATSSAAGSTAGTAGAVSAGLDFGSNLLNTFVSAVSVSKNRKFQERMARNAHQYEVDDLRRAGLNPVLSAGGRGADTPSGGVIDTPRFDLGKGYRETQGLKLQNEILKLNAAKTAQEIQTSKSQAFLYDASAIKEASQAKLNSAVAQVEEIKNELLGFERDYEKYHSQQYRTDKNAKWYEKAGDSFYRMLDRTKRYIPFMPR